MLQYYTVKKEIMMSLVCQLADQIKCSHWSAEIGE